MCQLPGFKNADKTDIEKCSIRDEQYEVTDVVIIEML